MIQQTAHILLFIVASAPVVVASTAAEQRFFGDASRDYRIETYGTFRQQRPEFNRRQRLGVEAALRWKEAKFDAQLRDQIVEWFVESTNATRKGVSLPELPGEPSRASQREAAAREAEAPANALSSSHANQSTSSAEPKTQQTSIVTDKRFVYTNEDRDTSDTVKILNSVGRAMTRAFINNCQSLDEVASPVDLLETPDNENPAGEVEDEKTFEQLQPIFNGDE